MRKRGHLIYLFRATNYAPCNRCRVPVGVGWKPRRPGAAAGTPPTVGQMQQEHMFARPMTDEAKMHNQNETNLLATPAAAQVNSAPKQLVAN